MPRYFFHTINGSSDEDEVGIELPDIAAARREAIRYGGSLLQDDPDILAGNGSLRIEVVDECERFCIAILIQAIDAERSSRKISD